MTITQKLFEVQDSEYREFQSKLVPNISKDSMIGVRTPQMRAIAKEFFGKGKTISTEAQAFFKELPHKYYEENMVHFFLVSMIKDFDECVKELEAFLPFIDCWPVCDQSSPKAFKKNREKLLPLIKKWIDSKHVYTARFGLRMLMNEFLDEAFKPEYLEWAAERQNKPTEGDDYYLKMMIAWYFATALAKQYDSSFQFIKNRRLETWTHNKAIQKAIESFRVSDEHKKELAKLKIN